MKRRTDKTSDSPWNLVGTIAIAGLNVSALAGGRMVLPMIALGMGASTFTVGAMSAMFTAVPMLASIHFGRWVDRTGTLVPVIFACCLIIAATAVFLTFASVSALFPVAGLIGASAFFASAAATRGMGASNNEAKRTKNIGYLVLGYSLAAFVGPVLTGSSYDNYGAAAALLAIGGIGVLSLLLALANVHHYVHAPTRPETRSKKQRLADLLLIATLRKWIGLNAVSATAQTLYPFVISLHAVNIGLSPTQAGLILAAFAAGMLVSRASIAITMRLLRSETLLTVAMLMAASIYAVLPWTHDIYLLLLLSLLLGMPLGIALPISLSLIYGAAPEGRINESVGLCHAVTSLLQTAAPFTLGIIASLPGAVSITWAVTFVLVLAAVAAGKSGRK